MLDFAMEYRKAIERITSDRTNDLQQFELSEEEWVIVKELRFTLKVRDTIDTCTSQLNATWGPSW